MRVCIVAEHASYKFGGEAVLPLHYFAHLRARGVEAWLIVHDRTKGELDALFAADKSRILYIRDAWFHLLLYRASRFLPRRIGEATVGLASVLINQVLQRRIVRDLLRTERINLVHQPIPVSPRFPSLMFGLGVPVVIGPMNGGMEYPQAFKKTESIMTRVSIRYGRQLSNLFNFLLPGKRLASTLLVANERTKLALPKPIRGEVVLIPENGVNLSTWKLDSTTRENVAPGRQKFVFIGRLVDWKGVDLAIEALAMVPGADLEIIGDGPMRWVWQQSAENAGVADRVFFCGFLTQRECAARLSASVALVLPSYYECGGAVVLEAMASGTPVIALNWGGPADYLDESCGYLIEPSSREEVVRGLAGKMQELLQDPALVGRLGANGLRKVQESFDWEKKTDAILSIYQETLARSGKTGQGVVAENPELEHQKTVQDRV